MNSATMLHVLTRVSLLVVSGGLLTLGTACGSNATTGGTGGVGGSGVGGSGVGGSTAADTAKYNFETSVQEWASTGTLVFTSVATSTDQHFAGAASLAGSITATEAGLATSSYALQLALAPAVVIPEGTVVKFRVYVPAGAPIDWIQPYIQEDISYAFHPVFKGTGMFQLGSWNTIDVIVPPALPNPILLIGVQFHNSAAWTGTVYVDSVNW